MLSLLLVEFKFDTEAHTITVVPFTDANFAVSGEGKSFSMANIIEQHSEGGASTMTLLPKLPKIGFNLPGKELRSKLSTMDIRVFFGGT